MFGTKFYTFAARSRSGWLSLGLIGMLVVASLWPGRELRAQLVCTGALCSEIPVSQAEFNQLFTELQYQYTRDLFDRMAEALVLANLSTPYTGTVNLNNAWTIGGNVGLGATENDELDVTATGVGIIEDVPTGGAAVNARLFVGVNVGMLFGLGHDPYGAEDETPEAPAWYSPARFDVYYGALKHTERINEEHGVNGRLRATTRSESVEIRYHLLEGSDIFGGPMLRFRGVSLGVGYSSMGQRLRYNTSESDELSILLEEGITLEWLGQNLMVMENNIRTTMIELRTGVQLLYFLNLTVGGGFARSVGQTDFLLTRFGPVILSNNPLASLFAGAGNTADLSLSLLERGYVPPKLYYLKAGIEFNILAFKLGIEGIMSRRNYGASVGARFEF